MMSSSSMAASELSKEEEKSKKIKDDPTLAKKFPSFHGGRAPTIISGVVFDVNDTEFTELLLDLD